MKIKLPQVTTVAAAVTTIACALFALPAAQAQTTSYHVTLNTSSLSGPYSMDFRFVDGGGDGLEPNNSAIFSNINYGAGGSGPTSGFTLNDDFPPAGVSSIAFTPGSLLSFDLQLTANPDQDAAPDALSLYLFQGGSLVATTGPADTLTVFTEPTTTGGLITVDTYTTTSGTAIRPVVTVQQASAAPEPSSLIYLGIVGGIAIPLGWRKRPAI